MQVLPDGDNDPGGSRPIPLAAPGPDISLRFTSADRFPTPDEYRRIPRDARCTVARRSSFVRVDTAAMPGGMVKFKQIKLTIQRTIDRGITEAGFHSELQISATRGMFLCLIEGEISSLAGVSGLASRPIRESGCFPYTPGQAQGYSHVTFCHHPFTPTYASRLSSHRNVRFLRPDNGRLFGPSPERT